MSFDQIPIEEKFVDVRGLKLFVRTEGKGKNPLIVLHGGPGSNHDYFVPYLGKLAETRPVILYDQRGCGKSERPSSPVYSIDDHVEELRSLAAELGFSKFDLLGHSWGGFLAQKYALEHQDTLRKLILCCTASNTIDIDADLRDQWKSLPQRDRKQIEFYLNSGKHERGQPYPSEYLTFVQELRNSVRKTPSPPMDISQYTSCIFAGFSWPVYASLMGGGIFEFKLDGELNGFDTRKRLHEIKVPTLIMAGRYDAFTPEEAGRMRNLIEGSKVVVFEKSGHWPFLEENSKFLSVTQKFLVQ